MAMSRITQLLKFYEENPNDSFVCFALALEYIKNGEPETGLQYFENLVQRDPDYVGTYYHLAKLYIKLGNKAAAEKCYADGMVIAKKLNDQHSLAELQNAAMNFSMGIEDDE